MLHEQELAKLPTDDERRKANAAMNALIPAFDTGRGVNLNLPQNGNVVEIELTPAVVELLLGLLNHVANGRLVTLVPYGAELTTQQAADILNVSRPHLIKLLEAGEIYFHMVGSHRKIPMEKLIEYKKKRDGKRSRALKELQRLGQEFDAS